MGAQFFVDIILFLLFSLQTYFNQDTLTLVRNLVTGSVNHDLDKILADGRSPAGVEENETIALARNRCRVSQLSLTDPLFESIGVSDFDLVVVIIVNLLS